MRLALYPLFFKLIYLLVFSGSEKVIFPVKMSVRVLSSSGFWMCFASSSDCAESLVSVVDSGDIGNTLRVFLGYTWNLHLPIQNMEDGACCLIELKRADTDAPIGWSYLKLSPSIASFPVPQGLSQLAVLPGGAPTLVGSDAAAPAAPVALPPLLAAPGGMALQMECFIQCV